MSLAFLAAPPIRFAEGRVQRGLAGVGLRTVRVGALLQQKLNELPVPVEHRFVQAEVVTERLAGFTLAQLMLLLMSLTAQAAADTP